MPPEDHININAAKEYVQSAEGKIDPAARVALNELKGALDASSQTHTKDALMKLAQAVDVAQTGEKKEFVLTEFEKRITLLSQRVETIDIPHNATAEYIVEKVYETGNETLIDGTELLLGTLNENLSNFSLSPYERENIKIGILGYVFDHYYEVLGGLKISDLQNIFSDLTKSFSDLTQLTKKPTKDVGIVDSLTNKWNALSGLVSGGSDSLSKVTGLLDNSSTLEDKVQKNLTGKFGPLIELLTKYRVGKEVPPEGDALSGFLSDPENILNFDKRFPAQTGAELEQKIAGVPRAPQEKTSELAAKLKTVFENKTAILDKVTGTGKDILDTFADSTDTSGPLSWGRDIALGVLKFLGNLPFIGNFIKGLLGIDANADMETYFGDEKRFQRLSAKSLRSLSEQQNSILTGKNLINVTTKRLAPFTKTYFSAINSNKDAKPEEKITSMSPDIWLYIIDKHEIPLPGGNKPIENPELHIGDSDFDSNGKPVKSFFEKINGLDAIISDVAPQAPGKTDPKKSSEETKADPKKPERPSIEGKSKQDIADIIFTQGNALVSEYRAGMDQIVDEAEKNFVSGQLDLISKALATKDVANIKTSLLTLNSENISKKLTPEQREALAYFNSLIKTWEEKKDEPDRPQPKTKPIDTDSTKKESLPPTLHEQAILGVRYGANQLLDWLKNKIN